MFGATNSRALERRRELVLEMSKRDHPIPRRELPALTPELARAYAGTERTLSRDLNALKGMGLIERVREGWKTRHEVILAFLPVRRDTPDDLVDLVAIRPPTEPQIRPARRRPSYVETRCYSVSRPAA
jgi:DNA-binding transcriptional ArsR family regulator